MRSAALLTALWFFILSFVVAIVDSFSSYSLADTYCSMTLHESSECTVFGAISSESRIGILTSGGDSQGMNAAIRSIVRMSLCSGYTPYGIYEGYSGLIDGHIHPLNWNSVAQIIQLGGTILGTARCDAFRTREGRMKAVENLLLNGISKLVVIGGDGSLTGAELLRQEWQSIVIDLVHERRIPERSVTMFPCLRIVGLVGSIDNDMVGTEFTIGANSALTRIVEAIDTLSTSANSHSRSFIIEVMGRHCGWLALMSSLACNSDWVLLPETPSEDWELSMSTRITLNREKGKRYSLVILCEGAVDLNGLPITSQKVKQVLTERLGMDSRITILGHIQRGGTPSAFDRVLATLQGVHAVHALISPTKPDSYSIIVGVQNNKIVALPLTDSVKKTRNLGLALESLNFSTAFNLRDPDFRSVHETMVAITMPLPKPLFPPSFVLSSTASRIAIIHTGSPACGMNMATFVFTRYAHFRWLEPIGLYGGWSSVIQAIGTEAESKVVRPLSWSDVDGWYSTGGSQLGLDRSLPQDLEKLADLITRYSIKGLFIVGGYEAFISMKILDQARSQYPALAALEIVTLPATISNNVPGSEQSLGSDTALNTLMNCCDTIRQSAASTKRVFVIECQGGNSGYLALFGGLAAGATFSYLPEEGITLADLVRDAAHLKARFQDDQKQGRLLIYNEKASSVFSPHTVAKVLSQEGGSLFDARDCSLGHLIQGANPSAMDRILAARWSALTIDHFLAKFANATAASQGSSSVIGLKNGRIVFSSLASLLPQSNDELRVARNPDWMKIRPIAKLMSKYPVNKNELDLELLEGQL